MLLWETEIQHRYYRSPTTGPLWPVGVWEGGLEQHQRGKKKNPCLESQTGTPIEKHVSGVYSLTLQRRKERAAESEMKLKIKRAIVIYDGTP